MLEGVALLCRSSCHGEGGRLLRLFAKEGGVLSTYFMPRRLGGVPSPLDEVEVVLNHGRGELWLCKELRVVRSWGSLRTSLDRLTYGSELLGALLHSREEAVASPLLYDLTVDYLERVCRGESGVKLLASYYLKLLRHEGLWRWGTSCSFCGSQNEAHWFAFGEELFCRAHTPAGAICLDEEAWLALELLAYCRGGHEFSLLSDRLAVRVLPLARALFFMRMG